MTEVGVKGKASQMLTTVIGLGARMLKLVSQEEALRKKASDPRCDPQERTRAWDEQEKKERAFTSVAQALVSKMGRLRSCSPKFSEVLDDFSFLRPMVGGSSRPFPLGRLAFSPRRLAEELPKLMKSLRELSATVVKRRAKKALSREEARTFKQIDRESLKGYTNKELWDIFGSRERTYNPKVTYNGFRHKLNRIRKKKHCPSPR
jgi:hypothetical protein